MTGVWWLQLRMNKDRLAITFSYTKIGVEFQVEFNAIWDSFMN